MINHWHRPSSSGRWRRETVGLLAVFFLVFRPFSLGCEVEDIIPAPATTGPETHPDVPLEQIPTEPNNNDPRGIFAPNNPLFIVFAPDVPGVTITELPLEKVGSGTVTLEGDLPNKGTYFTHNWYLSVRTTLTFTEEGQSVTFPVDASGVFVAGRGTWETFEDGIMVLDGRDSVEYAVDENGLYLILVAPYFRINGDFPPVEVPIIKALKK